MFNIVNFQQEINDEFSPSYKIYKRLYLENLLECPVIYTDFYKFRPDTIPIFPTFYIRENFNKKYILVDYQDYTYIPQYLRRSCIVVYNELFHDQSNISDCYLKIELESDAIKIIKERLK